MFFHDESDTCSLILNFSWLCFNILLLIWEFHYNYCDYNPQVCVQMDLLCQLLFCAECSTQCYKRFIVSCDLYKKQSQYKWTVKKVIPINSVHVSMNNALLKMFIDIANI